MVLPLSYWLVKVAHGDLNEEAECVMHGQVQRGFLSAITCMVHAILVGGSNMVFFRQFLHGSCNLGFCFALASALLWMCGSFRLASSVKMKSSVFFSVMMVIPRL